MGPYMTQRSIFYLLSLSIFPLFFLLLPLPLSIEKLGVDTATVRQSVQGLMFLLVESSKLSVNEIDFLDSIMILGFEEELNKELYAVSYFIKHTLY